ncbi:MAG: AraC family transcriptional regulator, partial [Lachnospiraceae bacterium]|nr:AraC family transcriptional regulator [Lachnospiraceae bacterium]
MTYPPKEETYLDYYTVNNDYLGERNVTDSHELVQFHNNSAVRIWCNEEAADFETHWHTALEIILPIHNYYDVTAMQISCHLLPGDILIIPPGEMHRLSAPESGRRFIYLLDSFIMKLNGFSSISSILSQPLLITKNTFPKIYDELYHILIRMQYEYFAQNTYAELSIYSLLLHFFAILGYDRIDSMDSFPNVRPDKKKEYIKKFNELLEYIDTHYMEELRLEDLAGMIGFSKYHFSRLF